MKIGIDISQMAYAQTGVANILKNVVENLMKIDRENEYILFYSSLRRDLVFQALENAPSNFKLKTFKLPPSMLDLVWNKLHVMPIEVLIGPVDIFITSDWTEPPTKKAKKATILYDLIVYKSPEETAVKIIETQKRKLAWVKKETDVVMCISESTKHDAMKILGIQEERLKVIYPGI